MGFFAHLIAKLKLQVINSTEINKYGYRFTIGALTRGAYAECPNGIPMLINHDASRLIGWSWPLAVHIEPGLARLTNIAGMVLDKNDQEDIDKRYHRHLYTSTVEGFEKEIHILKNKLSNFLSGQEKVVNVDCVALVEPDLTKRAFPQLFPSNDKHELISLDKLNPIGPGIFQIGEFIVFAVH